VLSLRDLQLAFTQELLAESGPAISDHIVANGLSGPQRLQVYRNNVMVGLTKSLRTTYPVVDRLVGEGFFDYAADDYIRRHPSASGDLHEFGAAFAAFLETFDPARELAYLPDVARLEWACHQVFHAAGHGPLDLDALSTIPQARHETVKFRLHPASHLLASPYPVLRIWQVNQDGYDGDPTVDLGEGGVMLLIIRRDLDIEIQRLETGEYALLQALDEDLTFAAACERALAAQPGFDLAGCFRDRVAQATLVDFHF
jgi:hypothetical protein